MFLSFTSLCLFITQRVTSNLGKYFPKVNCEELKKDLNNDLELMESYANMEWLLFKTMD